MVYQVSCNSWSRTSIGTNSPGWLTKVGEPFEQVSVHITGPNPRSAKGYVFMLTVMDHFSKWPEAIPMRNRTAPTVARTIMTHVFSRFGMPLQ